MEFEAQHREESVDTTKPYIANLNDDIQLNKGNILSIISQVAKYSLDRYETIMGRASPDK